MYFNKLNLPLLIMLLIVGCGAEKKDERTRGLDSAMLAMAGKTTDPDDGKDDGKHEDGKHEDGKGDDHEKEEIEHDDGHSKHGPEQNHPHQSDKDDDHVVKPEEHLPCRWFDPNNPHFAEVIPGGPVGVAIPIERYKDSGRYEGSNFIFSFRTYHINMHPGPGEERLDDQHGYWASYYTAIIIDADKESCTAIASGQIADRRIRGGCFQMTTRILMADGSEQFIALLKAGDEVRNPVTGQAQRIKRVIQGPEADKAMWEVGTLSSFTVVTGGHPFMTMVGLKTASQLNRNDLIIGADGQYHSVTHLVERQINSTQLVRNIELETDDHAPENHQVLADGVVAGDLYLQESLLD